MATVPKNLFRGKLKENWTVKPGGYASGTNSIAFGNGTFLTSNSGGLNTVYTNPALDGTSWTSRNLLSASANWVSAAFSNTNVYGCMAIASGANYVGWLSTPGATQVSYLPLPLAANWTGIASLYYSGNSTETWALIASGTNIALTSTDNGATWTQRTLPATANWTSITACPDINQNSGQVFIAVASGTNQAARSIDSGVTWQAVTMPATANWTSIAWYPYGSVAMAVASGTTVTAFFPGTTATPANTYPMPAVATWTAIAGRRDSMASSSSVTYHTFCAVASGGTTAASFNGSAWVSSVLPVSSNWVSVALGNTYGFVALSSTGANAYTTSPGGASLNWAAFISLPTNGGTTSWNTLAVLRNNSGFYLQPLGNGSQTALLFASAAMSATVSYSWFNMTPLAYCNAVGYGNNTFVALTSGTSWVSPVTQTTAYPPSRIAATSTDGGVTWTQRSMPAAAVWSSVVYGNGTFIAVSGFSPTSQPPSTSSTIAASSVDGGVTWTARALPTAATWVSTAYGNGVFVAIANGSSAAASSPDGVTWTARTLPPGAGTSWRSVIFGNGVFVAVGFGNFCATSTDGITWTTRTLPTNTNWISVVFGNGTFVAVTNSNALVAVSLDGINWSLRSMVTATNVSSGAYGNGQFAFMSNSTATGIAGYSEDTITVYTVPAGVTTVLTDIMMVNGPVTSNLGLKVAGEDLMPYQTVAANASISLATKQVLSPGDSVVGYASIATGPSVHINGVEIS